MFTTNGNQSQGTRQEWRGHKKAVVTWGYPVQLKKQVKKEALAPSSRLSGKTQFKQIKKPQDMWQMFSLPN